MASNPKVKPSVAGIWIGIILMLLGMGSCVGGPVLGVYSLVSQLSDADRYPVGTPQSFTFEDSAAGMIFGIAATGTDAAQVDGMSNAVDYAGINPIERDGGGACAEDRAAAAALV